MATLAAVVLAASATACSDGSADRGRAGANPTLATDPPTTTTTNPYAVPAVIDAAYLNRVLVELDAVMGDATRTIIRAKTITTDAYARMRAVYQNTEFLQLAVDGFEADMREEFRSYKPSPGNTVTSTTRLITATSSCIFAEVRRDYSNVGIAPSVDTGFQWVALKPLDRTRDPNGYNRTSWSFVYDGVTRDRSQPRNPCAAA